MKVKPLKKKQNSDPTKQNKHHIWEPAEQYTPSSSDDIEGQIAQRFRNHPAFVVDICIDGHALFNRYSQPPQKPPLRMMKKFLEEHPEKLYKKTRIPARITTHSISKAKSILGIVFSGLNGLKQILKISCANCNGRCCFEPIVEVVEPERSVGKDAKRR